MKHEKYSVAEQLKELKAIRDGQKLSAENKDKLAATITYFTNQGERMSYAEYREKNLPIGSGGTEAACKTTIKQRLCRSGMRWKDRGAAIVLALKLVPFFHLICLIFEHYPAICSGYLLIDIFILVL